MVNSGDDRLLSLVEDARHRFGDGVMNEIGQLEAFLTDQAPDQRDRIRALGAALAAGAKARVAAASDTQAAVARLAAEIAYGTGLNATIAMDGVNLALRIGVVVAPATQIGALPGPLPPPPASAPMPAQKSADADWVGMSAPVNLAPPPASPTPTLAGGLKTDVLKGWLSNKWVLIGAAALVVIYFSLAHQTTPPGDGGTPPQAPPPNGGPPAGTGDAQLLIGRWQCQVQTANGPKPETDDFLADGRYAVTSWTAQGSEFGAWGTWSLAAPGTISTNIAGTNPPGMFSGTVNLTYQMTQADAMVLSSEPCQRASN